MPIVDNFFLKTAKIGVFRGKSEPKKQNLTEKQATNGTENGGK